VAQGSRPGQFGIRNAPTLTYLAFSPSFGWQVKEGKRVPVGGFFWDGRADTLEQQASGPLLNPVEMNNASAAALVSKVANADYAGLLKGAWGDAVFADTQRAMAAIVGSLAAFERMPLFAPFTSKFDAALRGEAKLSEQEERGRSLFLIRQKGNCAACHTLEPDSRDPRASLFTDFGYHALGAPRNAAIARIGEFDLGLCTAAGRKLGREWCGFFKTPTLRNISLTAPYMHNGGFATLREAVAFYATRDTDPAQWYPDGRKFDDLPSELHGSVDLDTPPYHRTGKRPALKDDEIDDIVAFLNTLTDGWKVE
jgi:cytochrome c peroxidase